MKPLTRLQVLVFAVLNGIGNFLVATWHSGPSGTGPDWHGVGAFLAIAGGNVAVILGTLAFRRAGVSRTYLAVGVALGALGLACLLGLIFDTSLTVLPIGVIVFPGTGIQENLADKARKLGIPVWKFDNGGA